MSENIWHDAMRDAIRREARVVAVGRARSQADEPALAASIAEAMERILAAERDHSRKGTAAEKDVVAERLRQKAVEGYDDAHDDVFQHGQLGTAAACYALTGSGTFPPISAMPPGFWPWDLKWWKPSADRRDLVKAGALILAEIERLDRAKGEA